MNITHLWGSGGAVRYEAHPLIPSTWTVKCNVTEVCASKTQVNNLYAEGPTLQWTEGGKQWAEGAGRGTAGGPEASRRNQRPWEETERQRLDKIGCESGRAASGQARSREHLLWRRRTRWGGSFSPKKVMARYLSHPTGSLHSRLRVSPPRGGGHVSSL